MDRLLTVIIICSILLFFSEKMILDIILYGVIAIEFLIAGINLLRKKINWL